MLSMTAHVCKPCIGMDQELVQMKQQVQWEILCQSNKLKNNRRLSVPSSDLHIECTHTPTWKTFKSLIIYE